MLFSVSSVRSVVIIDLTTETTEYTEKKQEIYALLSVLRGEKIHILQRQQLQITRHKHCTQLFSSFSSICIRIRQRVLHLPSFSPKNQSIISWYGLYWQILQVIQNLLRTLRSNS